MSNTIMAKSRDSIFKSVSAVLGPISSRGSFMCFFRMSMILVATSSISLSHPAQLPGMSGPYRLTTLLITGGRPEGSLKGVHIYAKTQIVQPSQCLVLGTRYYFPNAEEDTGGTSLAS